MPGAVFNRDQLEALHSLLSEASVEERVVLAWIYKKHPQSDREYMLKICDKDSY